MYFWKDWMFLTEDVVFFQFFFLGLNEHDSQNGWKPVLWEVFKKYSIWIYIYIYTCTHNHTYLKKQPIGLGFIFMCLSEWCVWPKKTLNSKGTGYLLIRNLWQILRFHQGISPSFPPPGTQSPRPWWSMDQQTPRKKNQLCFRLLGIFI